MHPLAAKSAQEFRSEIIRKVVERKDLKARVWIFAPDQTEPPIDAYTIYTISTNKRGYIDVDNVVDCLMYKVKEKHIDHVFDLRLEINEPDSSFKVYYYGTEHRWMDMYDEQKVREYCRYCGKERPTKECNGKK